MFFYIARKQKDMKVSGGLVKMEVSIGHSGSVVGYGLVLAGKRVEMNVLIGRHIRISWLETIRCLSCGGLTKKSYGQGYCYPCYISIPEAEPCILRPELCRAHEGVARSMEWATSHCLQPHYVYLALSGGLKVGVTRKTQVPTRWIDQGASSAICIAELPNRYLAGSLEVALKANFSDKTDWRKMLRGVVPEGINLMEQRKRARTLFPANHAPFFLPNNNVFEIRYPVEKYPVSIVSSSLEKDKTVEGILTGIRGQYLMLDGQKVINLRTFSGYEVVFETE